MADSLPPYYEEDCAKLRTDLKTVAEKTQLYAEMLAGGIAREDDMLREVVGFLEACRERLGDVIEAGSLGKLPESIFESALQANGLVLQTLESDKNGTIPPQAMLTASKTISSGGGGGSANLLDLDLDDLSSLQLQQPPALPVFAPPASAATSKPQAAPAMLLEPPSPVADGEQANPLLLAQSTSQVHKQSPAPAPAPAPAPGSAMQDDFDSFLASLKK